MKKITTNAFFILAFILIPNFTIAQSTAIYTIEFVSSWNDPDHGTLPVNAHWSDLVGATHNSDITFWEVGTLASPGVEDVAEIGVNTNFNAEVNTAISNGDADQWLQMAFDAPNDALSGATLTSVSVSEDYPLLTLLSMIAPSPDWFIGINSFSLLDGSNNWKNSLSIDLFPYDAGTEEGTGYSTSNAASTPHVVIFDRSSTTPFIGPKIGTLNITLENVLNTEEVALSNAIALSPNPASSFLNISNSSSNALKSVSIYNVLGNLVEELQISSNQNTFRHDISQMASGLYLVKMEDSSGRQATKKLIIQ